MHGILLTLLLLASSSAFAQQVEPSFQKSAWATFPGQGGCIGGSTCADRRLRVALEERPVIAVRFRAHDQIGNKTDGVLRVKIDGNIVNGYIDVPRAGKTFSIDVDDLIGRYLVFEPVTDDEVEISDIEVMYAARSRPDRGRDDRPRRDGGWREYASAAGCIGGEECRQNGNRITIALEDAPVLAIRFFAHDAIGSRADGRLSVRVDDTAVQSYIDVQRNGKRHDIEVDSIRGRRLVIETTTNDEVEIRDLEVLYGRARRGERWSREVTHEGGCIGGSECGGRRARIRIPLHGRTVASVRFYARDDVGTRAGGELRIRVDDVILHDYLDIPREGRTFTIDGRGAAGDYLIIEPAEDDEVVVRDVRVTFTPDEE